MKLIKRIFKPTPGKIILTLILMILAMSVYLSYSSSFGKYCDVTLTHSAGALSENSFNFNDDIYNNFNNSFYENEVLKGVKDVMRPQLFHRAWQSHILHCPVLDGYNSVSHIVVLLSILIILMVSVSYFISCLVLAFNIEADKKKQSGKNRVDN